MLNIKVAICLNGFEAHKICINSTCQKQAFICYDNDCQCHVIHRNCQNHEMKPILDQISSKLNNTVGPLQDLVDYYDQIVKMVLIEKNELLGKLDRIHEMVYQEEQSKFIEAIENNTVITGEQAQKVLDQLTKQNKFMNFGIDLKAESLKTKRMIEQGLANLKRIWRKKKKISEQETKARLRQCQVRYVYVNGKWNKPLQISSSFKQLPLSVVQGYDLDYIDQTVVEGLAFHCPKLRRLQIGVASQFTKVDDSCCEMIADQLRQLDILKIHHSPNITDRGAIALAGKLSAVSEFELVDCHVSEQGKKDVKKLLSNCEKIKF